MDNNIEMTALTFEDFSRQNGILYWLASDLIKMLDYDSMDSFKKAIDRAIRACMTLNIKWEEHFINIVTNGEFDYKLTRFACYLTVMNADTKKEKVAKAQAYFIYQTRQFELLLQSDDIERLLDREELKLANKTLFSTAQKAGVADFAKFNNAGYLGLYNMNIWQIKKTKGLDKNVELQDYMGSTELAANRFRAVMTEEKLKKDKIYGQHQAEKTHHDVAKQVRDMVIENTGIAPEELKPEQKLPDLKKQVKQTAKEFNKLDKKKIN